MAETWPFLWGARTYLMGVLNVTPDSFSGDGILGTQLRAADRAREIAGAGADIVDIGGESTRPGHRATSVEEELRRVIPAIQQVAGTVDVPISVDTRKADVARQAAAAGASIVNDVSGLSDPEMAPVVAYAKAGLIIVHSEPSREKNDVLEGVCSGLEAAVGKALRAGVPSEKIAVDPGLGFHKNWRQNLDIMRRLGELKALGFPIVIGPSRKATISHVLGVAAGDRMEGTAALVSVGIAQGADVVRVHDVAFMREVSRMTDALAR